MPQEATAWMALSSRNSILFQIIGGLYFSYAMINWMSRGNLIGGIYNRPLAVANLTHFCIVALALLKINDKTMTLSIITAVYLAFAVAFGIILFTHPVKESKTE
jgi:hypothetical protein